MANKMVYTKSLYPNLTTQSAFIDLDNGNFLNANWNKKICKNYKNIFNSLKEKYLNEIKNDVQLNSTFAAYSK